MADAVQTRTDSWARPVFDTGYPVNTVPDQVSYAPPAITGVRAPRARGVGDIMGPVFPWLITGAIVVGVIYMAKGGKPYNWGRK